METRRPPNRIMTADKNREMTAIIAMPVPRYPLIEPCLPAPLLWATMVEMADPRLTMGSSMIESMR